MRTVPGKPPFSLTGTAACWISGALCPVQRPSRICFQGYAGTNPWYPAGEYVEAIWEGRPYHVCLNRYIHLTLGELADIQARRFPDREAVVDSLAGVRLTYREVKRRSDGLAKG